MTPLHAAAQALIDRFATRKTGMIGDTEPEVIALRAALAVEATAEPVGTLTLSKFRGHLQNHSFDYTGNLPDGSHTLYALPKEPK